MILEKIKGERYGYSARCKCDYCGKEFKRCLSNIKNHKKNYCSLGCRYKGIVGKNYHLGYKHSEEIKRKISKAILKRREKLGYIHSPETRKKLSKAKRGTIISEETKKKISKTRLKRKERLGYLNSPKTRRKISLGNLGKKMSEESRLKMSEYHKSIRGIKTHNWKGGRYKNTKGYVLIINYDHPYRYKDNHVLEHRLVMEKFIGRILKPKEVVHHINGDVEDNQIKNLMLFANKSEHQKYERAQKGEAISI